MVRITRKTFDAIREDMRRCAHVVLTNEQIQMIAEKCPSSVRQDLRMGAFDTYDREYFMDRLVQKVMTRKDHWPLNMETGTEYSETFPNRYAAGCKRHKIEFVPFRK